MHDPSRHPPPPEPPTAANSTIVVRRQGGPFTLSGKFPGPMSPPAPPDAAKSPSAARLANALARLQYRTASHPTGAPMIMGFAAQLATGLGTPLATQGGAPEHNGPARPARSGPTPDSAPAPAPAPAPHMLSPLHRGQRSALWSAPGSPRDPKGGGSYEDVAQQALRARHPQARGDGKASSPGTSSAKALSTPTSALPVHPPAQPPLLQGAPRNRSHSAVTPIPDLPNPDLTEENLKKLTVIKTSGPLRPPLAPIEVLLEPHTPLDSAAQAPPHQPSQTPSSRTAGPTPRNRARATRTPRNSTPSGKKAAPSPGSGKPPGGSQQPPELRRKSKPKLPFRVQTRQRPGRKSQSSECGSRLEVPSAGTPHRPNSQASLASSTAWDGPYSGLLQRALVIGISNYKDPRIPTCMDCGPDALHIAGILRKQGYVVTAMHDQVDEERLVPKHEHILATLAALEAATTPAGEPRDDPVLVVVLGRGGWLSVGEEHLFVAPVDTQLEDLPSNAIRVDAFKGRPWNQNLVVIDALPFPWTEGIASSAGFGLVTGTGSLGSELKVTYPPGEHSALSHYLAHALLGHPFEAGPIDINSLNHFLALKLKKRRLKTSTNAEMLKTSGLLVARDVSQDRDKWQKKKAQYALKRRYFTVKAFFDPAIGTDLSTRTITKVMRDVNDILRRPAPALGATQGRSSSRSLSLSSRPGSKPNALAASLSGAGGLTGGRSVLFNDFKLTHFVLVLHARLDELRCDGLAAVGRAADECGAAGYTFFSPAGLVPNPQDFVVLGLHGKPKAMHSFVERCCARTQYFSEFAGRKVHMCRAFAHVTMQGTKLDFYRLKKHCRLALGGPRSFAPVSVQLLQQHADFIMRNVVLVQRVFRAWRTRRTLAGMRDAEARERQARDGIASEGLLCLNALLRLKHEGDTGLFLGAEAAKRRMYLQWEQEDRAVMFFTMIEHWMRAERAHRVLEEGRCAVEYAEIMARHEIVAHMSRTELKPFLSLYGDEVRARKALERARASELHLAWQQHHRKTGNFLPDKGRRGTMPLLVSMSPAVPRRRRSLHTAPVAAHADTGGT